MSDEAQCTTAIKSEIAKMGIKYLSSLTSFIWNAYTIITMLFPHIPTTKYTASINVSGIKFNVIWSFHSYKVKFSITNTML